MISRLRKASIADPLRFVDLADTELSLAGVPPWFLLALMSLNVITVSTALAIGLGATLMAFDLLTGGVVAAMFDRERLVTCRHG